MTVTSIPTLNQVLPYGDGQTDIAVTPISERSLSDLLAGSPFLGYTYGYPHKTAYRPFAEPLALQELWREEDLSALFLYLHVPFCEMRCGFCNLFTQARPKADLPSRYLDTLESQADRLDDLLGPRSFARVAFGGGTPTQLELPLLERLLDVAERLGASLNSVPVSVETSPETATAERIALLESRGIERISIGIQSFDRAELKALGRPQDQQTRATLDRLRAASFATLNLDLIYGIPGQTLGSWLQSLRTALAWQPQELYLYPLYLRPLTGLGKLRRECADQRLELYRAARDLLLSEGYEQFSMRLFRRPRVSASVYRCQEDAMLGLGCGARSYTQGVHYSDEWAVAAKGVKQILSHWVDRDAASFEHARYGYQLDREDCQRRYLLLSLLNTDGVDRQAYRQRFGSEVLDDLPRLAELSAFGLAEISDGRICLTARGLEWSDALGPWLYSARAQQLSGEFDLT